MSHSPVLMALTMKMAKLTNMANMANFGRVGEVGVVGHRQIVGEHGSTSRKEVKKSMSANSANLSLSEELRQLGEHD